MLTIRHFQAGRCERVERERLGEVLASDEGWVWLDLEAAGADELAALHEAGVHPRIIEDMVEDAHLPKADQLGDQLGLTVHALLLPAEVMTELRTTELDIALRSDLLVTYHHPTIGSVTRVAERIDRGDVAGLERPAQLLHRILDVLHDVFVPFLDLVERRLDVVEEDILTEPTEATRREIYGLQRDVIQLRRALVPQAEVIRRLGREPVGALTEADLEYLRDIHDHLYRLVALTDSYRQLLDSAMDSYRSTLEDDLNDMLRVLTLLSATILPISVLAGIYGMNFEHMPELAYPWAYPALWGVFVTIVVAQLLWFRRRGWIGRRAERRADARRALLPEVMELPVLGTVLKVPAYGARAVTWTGSRLFRAAANRGRPGRSRRRRGPRGGARR